VAKTTKPITMAVQEIVDSFEIIDEGENRSIFGSKNRKLSGGRIK